MKDIGIEKETCEAYRRFPIMNVYERVDQRTAHRIDKARKGYNERITGGQNKTQGSEFRTAGMCFASRLDVVRAIIGKAVKK